jgi:hypothetical protein
LAPGPEHVLVELRRVGVGLCADLARWIATRTDAAAPALSELVAACRAQLAQLTGPLPSVDEPVAHDGADSTTADGPTAEDEKALLAALLAVESGGRASAASTGASTGAASGAVPPLVRLGDALGLSDLDVEMLLLAALPEESSLWGSLFGFLSGGGAGLGGPAGTGRRPTVHLALNFGTPSPLRHDLLRRLTEGPLVRFGLLSLQPPEAPLADRALVLAPELWPSLRGLEVIDPALAPLLVSSRQPETQRSVAGRSAPVVAPDELVRAGRMAAAIGAGAIRRGVLIGGTAQERSELARFIAAEAGFAVVEVRLPIGAAAVGAEATAWGVAAVRHAAVRGAALVLLAPAASGEPIPLSLEPPARMPCLLALPDKADVRGPAFDDAPRLRIPPATFRERQARWQRAIANEGQRLGVALGLPATDLARRYHLEGDAVDAAVAEATRSAVLDGRSLPLVSDVARAVRERPAVRLEALARRRRPVARPADLVLSTQATLQLDELVARLRHRDRVFDEWGLVPHGAHRPGVLALFTGPSGTGKTLAAEVIAGRLDLDLYAVDLSQVVSKYIGETEKNLARVFDAVEGSAAVLLFDEADAVFGKRTETRDAHDRYANLEVSYLLARLETFTGLAVLASNLRGNIDIAFLRRMDFIVEFVQPDTEARRRLLEAHLRGRAPLAPDVDPARLAEAFAVSGAHIRNAVVAAAFRAADEGGPLAMEHLGAAMRREYEKLGKAFPALSDGGR